MRGPTVVERDKDKMKALDLALAGIEKAHGKGAVMKMREKGSMDIQTVPTGALALDLALGLGGLPRGRVPALHAPAPPPPPPLALPLLPAPHRPRRPSPPPPP